MYVTPPVSHVEMWPYVASAAVASSNHAATAVLIVLSSATRGETVGAGVGAAVGPLLGAFAMRYLGDAGLFVFMGLIGLGFLGFVMARMRENPPVPSAEQSRFEPVIPAPTSAMLDPRVEPGPADP